MTTTGTDTTSTPGTAITAALCSPEASRDSRLFAQAPARINGSSYRPGMPEGSGRRSSLWLATVLVLCVAAFIALFAHHQAWAAALALVPFMLGVQAAGILWTRARARR